MRQAGALSNRDDAVRLADYLLTLGISTRVEPAGTGFAVWVREEDQLPQATTELQKFLTEPQAERYRQAGSQAEALRKQQLRDDQERQKNLIEVRKRWDGPAAGRYPLTIALIVISVIVAVATDLGERRFTGAMPWLLFSSLPPEVTQVPAEWTPTKAIEAGQVWRLVTPMFIHFGPMHLFFNMYALYLFGSAIEVRRGSWRLGALVLAISLTSNFAEYYATSHIRSAGPYALLFGGMSGVDFGLFGYLWMKSSFDRQFGYFLSPITIVVSIVWFIACWVGLFGPIANWAHGMGLLVGMLLGYLPTTWAKLR